MNAEHEQASAFLTHSSLAWSESMAKSQIVSREQIVAVLAEYRKITNGEIAALRRQSSPDYYFVRVTLHDGGRTAWARQTKAQSKPANGFVVFELVESDGTPKPNGRVRVKVGAYEASAATLVNGKLKVED